MRKVMAACVVGAALVLTTSADASWLNRLMPGRFAAPTTPKTFVFEGRTVAVRAHLSHDLSRTILRLQPNSQPPVIETIAGPSTGIHLEFWNGATDTAFAAHLQVLYVEVLQGNRVQFHTNVRPGVGGTGLLRFTSNIAQVGHGPALPVNGEYSIAVTFKGARGPVRFVFPATDIPSTTARLYYTVPVGASS